MPRSKKVGGVKQSRQGVTSAASATDATPRRVGGVSALARGGHLLSCPQNCPGEYIAGMWIHSLDCPWVAVIWKAHCRAKIETQWRCPYDCDPVEHASCWTHPYDCPFWNYTDQTPFDQRPPHDEPVQSAMGSALLGADTVRQQKERMRRGDSQEIPTTKVLPKNFPK